MQMIYRADIDGLRAVAVLPVILFHAGYSWIPGGFVGVDVFFVISGFLISSILFREMEQQQFTFLRFYTRRALRIIPALFIMLVITQLAAYFFLLPDEYIHLSTATLASISFVPNIYFWTSTIPYFGVDLATHPLLHTWSLGIEEQFYILFPALLLILHKYGTRKIMLHTLLAIFTISLILTSLFSSDFTQFTFYMLPTRAWELLAGVLLGIGFVPAIHNKTIANLGAVIGLSLIIGTMLLLDEHSIFSNLNIVYPVLGTVLIIHCNTSVITVVSWLLKRQLLVFIGLISYSLYLWHWPVTVYTHMITDTNISRLFIVALSFLLAIISFQFVETRFRKKPINTNARSAAYKLGTLGVITIGIAVVVISQHGLPDRIPQSAFQVATTSNFENEDKQCRAFSENTLSKEMGKLCLLGKSNTEPQFILWGDSHAQALSHAFHLAALKTGTSGYLISNSGCRPLTGVYRKHKKKCLKFNKATLEFIKTITSIEEVFLAGYWRVPLTTTGYDNQNFYIMDDVTQTSSAVENRLVFRRGLLRTIKQLKDHRITIIEDIPEIGSQFGKSIANHFIRQAWFGISSKHPIEFKRIKDKYEQEFNSAIASLPENSEILKIKPWLCHEMSCPLISDGKLIYADGDHLSQHGASMLVPAIMPYMASYETTIILTDSGSPDI